MKRLKNNHGGILVTALLLTMLLSYLFIITLEDYHLSKKFVHHTRNFYLAKTMKNLCFHEIKDTNLKSGKVIYNIGSIDFTSESDKLIFSVHIGKRTYHFSEKQPKTEPENTNKENMAKDLLIQK